MLEVLRSVLGLGGKALDRILPDRARLLERQLEINAETERASGGGMTPRKLLMYLLVCCLAWEMVARPVVELCWPEVVLPESMLREVLLAVSALFGVGI